MSTISPAARPVAVDGGPVGVLLLHGFTGSPSAMRPWAEHLAAAGHTVRAPRLPGHGTTWQELNRTRWTDWYAVADRALDELSQRCERVVVAGLSMGGALALRLAEERGDDVDALVLVNPAVHLRRLDLRLVGLLKHLRASVPGVAGDIRREGVDEAGYDRTPLAALHSQTRLWKVVRDDLASVTQPLLMFRSVTDHVLDPSSGELVMDGVSSAVRHEVLLHESYHVATLDHDMDLVFAESASFIATQVGGPRVG